MSKVRFIAGSGRSGTTWVLDAIARANGLRPVFEPLHPWVSGIGAKYAHRALVPGEMHAELKNFLREVIDGRRARLWTQYRRQPNWILPSRANLQSTARALRFVRRLVRFVVEAPGLAAMALRREPIVKCIWANLMLGWLADQLECQIVLVVRHPGAVIESELRGGWRADGTLEQFRHDSGFHDATSGRYVRLLERPLADVEALALRWLIENQAYVESGSRGAISVAYFEDLARPDRSAWEPVCRHLGIHALPETALLERPSQQSSTRATRSADEIAGTSWRNVLGPERCARIQGLLDDAGFDGYSMTDSRPRIGKPVNEAIREGTAR